MVAVCQDGDTNIIISQYAGQTLREWLEDHDPAPALVAQVMQELEAAVTRLHQMGLVHGDLN